MLLGCGTPVAAADDPPGAPQAPAAASDPFARRAWLREISGQVFAESWNYNTSREELYGGWLGLGYGWRDNLVVTLQWPVLYVSQRGADAYTLGMLSGVRWRVARRGRVATYLEANVGISRAERVVPPRGTRTNYLLMGGAGVTLPIGGGAHLITGARWMHLSNNSLAGRDRNPDIQALGLHAGVLLPF